MCDHQIIREGDPRSPDQANRGCDLGVHPSLFPHRDVANNSYTVLRWSQYLLIQWQQPSPKRAWANPRALRFAGGWRKSLLISADHALSCPVSCEELLRRAITHIRSSLLTLMVFTVFMPGPQTCRTNPSHSRHSNDVVFEAFFFKIQICA